MIAPTEARPGPLLMRLFVDYWNLSAGWKENASPDRICWQHLLGAIRDAVAGVIAIKHPALRGVTLTPSAALYTSIFNPSDAELSWKASDTGIPLAVLRTMRTNDQRHMNWVTGQAYGSLGGWKKTKPQALNLGEHSPTCLRCGTRRSPCERCTSVGAAKDYLVVRREKGVDMQLGTELIEFAYPLRRPHTDTADDDDAARAAIVAWQPSVVVVLSNDADFIPAVKMAEGYGLVTVAVAWRHRRGKLPDNTQFVVWLDDIRQTISMGPQCRELGAP